MPIAEESLNNLAESCQSEADESPEDWIWARSKLPRGEIQKRKYAKVIKEVIDSGYPEYVKTHPPSDSRLQLIGPFTPRLLNLKAAAMIKKEVATLENVLKPEDAEAINAFLGYIQKKIIGRPLQNKPIGEKPKGSIPESLQKHILKVIKPLEFSQGTEFFQVSDQSIPVAKIFQGDGRHKYWAYDVWPPRQILISASAWDIHRMWIASIQFDEFQALVSQTMMKHILKRASETSRILNSTSLSSYHASNNDLKLIIEMVKGLLEQPFLKISFEEDCKDWPFWKLRGILKQYLIELEQAILCLNRIDHRVDYRKYALLFLAQAMEKLTGLQRRNTIRKLIQHFGCNMKLGTVKSILKRSR